MAKWLNQLRALFQTEAWMKEESTRWAATHYPEGEARGIAQRVAEITVNQLNVNFSQLAPGTRFLEDLMVDDLDGVELIMAFEEEFKAEFEGREIPERHAEMILTIGDMVGYVKDHGLPPPPR